MAIRPEDLTRLSAFDESVLKDYEEQIDKDLENEFNGSSKSIYLSSTPSMKIQNALRTRYQNAGWIFNLVCGFDRNESYCCITLSVPSKYGIDPGPIC